MATPPTSRHELAELLRTEIHAGAPSRTPGTVVSGRQLAKELGCARNTLIGAMEILEQEGLVRSIPKVGYMMMSPAAAFEARLDRRGHVHPVPEQADDRAEMVTTAVRKASAAVAAALGGPPDMGVVLRQSILIRAGAPWAIEETYIPQAIADAARRLLDADLVDEDQILEEAGLPETGHSHAISGRPAADQEAALLKSRATSLLSVQRVSYSGEQARSCEILLIHAGRVSLAGSSGKVPKMTNPGAPEGK
ncbi:UTRA domain-containing protein [Streptomyces sp. NPDC091416]|uniref:UTRA domain-containing protein n=1 Tax=Streptomyces sp. NPDC091416 TaxID=3366003 RepID=UPI0038008C24